MVAVLLALTVAALASPETGLSGTDSVSRGCPVATGPTFKPPGEKARNEYRIAAVGAPCSFAAGWMRQFATRSIRSLPTPLAGPPGWRCTGFPNRGWRLKAYAGLCTKGTLRFSWAPRFSPGE